jgi:hypothetical protein
MKLLYGTAISFLLCTTMLTACGKNEGASPSNYEKLSQASTQAMHSTIEPTDEKWQNGAMGFRYIFNNGRIVDCIRLGSSDITCDWSERK